MKYTGGDINRLGNRLRKGPNYHIADDDLDLLQVHRLSFTKPLFKIFRELTPLKSKVQRTGIIAFRLKRISTIINKLYRKPDMQLNRMWDIAGIRLILLNERQVRRVLEEIMVRYEIRGRPRDYFLEPKKIGYKAIHVYITEPQSKKVIEVQLRTIDSHNWATLVEITDVLYNTRLKEDGFENDITWGRFHNLVSSEKELSGDEANFLFKALDRYDFISKLADTFRKNSYIVKKQWQEVGHHDKYFLIESSAENTPVLTSYRDYEKAELDYFQKYKEDETALIVLTSIHKPSFDQISIAYANYILSYHNFIKDVQEILKSLAIEKLEIKKFREFRKIFRLYEVIQANNIINILIERDDVTVKIEGQRLLLRSNSKLSSKKRREIKKVMRKGMDNLSKQHKIFINEITENINKKSLQTWRTRAFLKKHEQRVTKKLKSIDLKFEKG